MLPWFQVHVYAHAGADGCAFTVTAVTPEIQALSTVLLTKILCEPDVTPEKIVDA